MTVTIRDVARKLNLSITTVSRALDGYKDVAEETRQEVIRAANEMGYVPNRAARQLRRQQTDTIGFILPTPEPSFNDPFFNEFLAGVGSGTAQHRFDLLVSTAPPDSALERQTYTQYVQSRRVDGVALNRLRLNDWRVHYLAQTGTPFVTLGRLGNLPSTARYAYIEVDNQAAVCELTLRLARHGHRRIAFLGGPETLQINAERQTGYCEGLQNAGLPCDDSLILHTAALDPENTYEAALTLLTRTPRPTALVCVNDLAAINAIKAAHSLGIAVGRELAVSGFDGLPYVEHTTPPLTTLHQPLYNIASRLVTLLIGLLSDRVTSGYHETIQPELIARASTEFDV